MKTIQLLSVFVENKPGFLAKATQALAKANANILWFKIIDATDEKCGLLRLLLDDTANGITALKAAGFIVHPVDAIAVVTKQEDTPGILSKLVAVLAEKNINIKNGGGYYFHGHAVLILETEDPAKDAALLEQEGYALLDSK